MIKVIEGQDPYNVIGKYIRDHITVIEDIIAVIKINEVETNQLFMVDGDMNKGNYFIWENDWWEGEKDVTLIDFFPVSEAQRANQSVDTISRQAAIDAFEDFIGEHDDADPFNLKSVTMTGIRQILKALPPAEPERHWIPVSERMPKYRETVLISSFWGVRVAWRDAIKEDGTDDFWVCPLEDSDVYPQYVYAWMPLPQPYNGG